MVYRPTARVEAHKADVRRRIVSAARRRVADAGFGGASVAAVAREAAVAIGTVYRYFPSKAELLVEVFRQASAREVETMAAAAIDGGPASAKLERAIRVFARRAIEARRLAYALIAEPAMPEIEAERLVYRRAYAQVVEAIVREGVERGEFGVRDPSVAAACIVGALAEALVVPLAVEGAGSVPEAPMLIDAMVDFCLRAVSPHPPPSHPRLSEDTHGIS